MPEPLPMVSVVVPVYNAVDALGRLFESLLGQDYPADRREIFCVDNGSTDGGLDYLRNRPEATAISQTKWQGPGATRNAALDRVRGEIVAFIDADCWAHRDWLRRGVGALLEGKLDRVAGRVEFVLRPRPNFYELYDAGRNFKQTDFVAQGWCGTGNLFVRRGVFDEVGLFDPELISHEDSEWGMRATRAGKSLGYAPGAVVYHRARTSMLSLARKWFRTEYGAAQVYRKSGLLELQLWTKKANYRPLIRTWTDFPPELTAGSRFRFEADMMANLLRCAGNMGNFCGYFGLGRRRGGQD